MRRIANPAELQTELRELLVYSEAVQPSRKRIAAALESMSSRLAGTVAPSPTDFVMISRLTKSNHHTEAYIEGCKLLGFKALEKRLLLVQQLRDLEGHMPRGLGDYQYALYKEMLVQAKQVLSPQDYETFYACF